LRVGSATLERLDAFLIEAESEGPASASETLVRIALAYCDFAADNLQLWRALFEHRMAPGKLIPDGRSSADGAVPSYLSAACCAFPTRSAAELSVTARSLFSRCMHGDARLEQKLIAVPIDACGPRSR